MSRDGTRPFRGGCHHMPGFDIQSICMQNLTILVLVFIYIYLTSPEMQHHAATTHKAENTKNNAKMFKIPSDNNRCVQR